MGSDDTTADDEADGSSFCVNAGLAWPSSTNPLISWTNGTLSGSSRSTTNGITITCGQTTISIFTEEDTASIHNAPFPALYTHA